MKPAESCTTKVYGLRYLERAGGKLQRCRPAIIQGRKRCGSVASHNKRGVSAVLILYRNTAVLIFLKTVILQKTWMIIRYI
jgi:hypothetical protein